jgi:hypothetical protein
MKRELKPLHLQKPSPPELQTGQIAPASYLVAPVIDHDGNF